MSVKSYYTFTPSASQAFGAPRGGGRKHRGVDRSTSTRPGNPVPALLGGKVTGKLSPSSSHGFGYQVTTEVSYNGRRYRVSYAHGSKASPLRTGQTFSQGTTVITEGTTGATNGSCVHIEVYDIAKGVYINPMILINAVVGGSSGGGGGGGTDVVRQRQDFLNKARGEKLSVDGKSGPLTRAAIKRYQSFLRGYGYTGAIDGLWGSGTQAAHARYYDVWSKPVTPPSSGRPTIRRGSTGDHVRALQSKLKSAYSLYAGKLSVDGQFGPATEKAVREFQRRAGLAVDGIVGPQTWARLGL